MKKTIILFGILAVIFLVGQGCEKPVACTEDAKICPDGTALGRTGPNCEFPECPKLGDCGKVEPEFRDSCCAEKMKDQPHIMCVGNWQYDIEAGGCKFECGTTPIGITKECAEENVVGVYECKDGIKKTVSGLLGGGFKLIHSDGTEESCPVVALEYLSENCKDAAEEGYCADKNMCE